MPRRDASETGWYHITVRSAGQIQLFEDDDDRRRYLTLLREACTKVSTTIVAWVLMSDHVHLLAAFETQDAMSVFMQYVDSRYSRYFNAKTGRPGTLFQGTFWSRPVLNEGQLIATTHYIHMNPESAGMATMRSYRWSSYQEYAGKHWIVDTSIILDMFGSFALFDKYEGSVSEVVRQHRRSGLTDDAALAEALRISGANNSAMLRRLGKQERNEIVLTLYAQGFAARTIARTLGIGHATVGRIING